MGKTNRPGPGAGAVPRSADATHSTASRPCHHMMAGLVFWCATLATLAGCAPIAETASPVLTTLEVPQLLDWSPTGPTTVALSFSKPVLFSPEAVAVSPSLVVTSVTPEGSGGMVITFGDAEQPGREYALRGVAEDTHGNSVQFLIPFTGYNGRVPRMLINEFTTQGSSTHPDRIELFVRTAGNTAGVTLFVGTKLRHSARFVFPAVEVAAGDYLILHAKPQGIPEEVNETTDTAASGGYDADPAVRDFWLSGGTGLSGSNGVLSLRENPAGKILDAVFYTLRTSESDTEYGGFGSTSLREMVGELVEEGAWKAAGATPVPEDGASSAGTTATRSICRSAGSADTDLPGDWHIVPTRMASFGAANSDEAYVPSE